MISPLLRTLALTLMISGLVLGVLISDETRNGKKKPAGEGGITILPSMTTQSGLPGTIVLASFEISDIADGLLIQLPQSMGDVVAQLVLPGSSAQVQIFSATSQIFIEGSILTQLSQNKVDAFEINVVGSNGGYVKLKFVFGANGTAKITVY